MPSQWIPILWGLSPPTRGNPNDILIAKEGNGSIPAHAGEPRRRSATPCSSRVYPRPRGGTAVWRGHRRIGDGLSPPTRGNHEREGGEGGE